jgi:hypothetical protein
MHRQNGNTQAQITATYLLMAFEKIDQERCWRDASTEAEDIRIAVPMPIWADITECAKKVSRQAREMPGVFGAFASLIRSVRQSDLYHAKTREVMLPLQTWSDLLLAHGSAKSSAWVTKAYATEHYIRHERFS